MLCYRITAENKSGDIVSSDINGKSRLEASSKMRKELRSKKLKGFHIIDVKDIDKCEINEYKQTFNILIEENE